MDEKVQPVHILLIEDDPDVSESISLFLTKHEFSVAVAPKYDDIDAAFAQQAPDVIILDLHIPGGKSGADICKLLRQRTQAPIIILTGESEDIDKIILLELGADNYLTKPILPHVLLSFLRALLRRVKEKSEPSSSDGTPVKVFHDVMEFSNFSLNISTRTLYNKKGKVIHLKPAEYRLLVLFLEHPEQVLSRDRLLDLRSNESVVLDRTIDALVSRLRRHLEKDPKHPKLIKTYRNGGYLFQAQVIRKKVEQKE